MRAAPLLPVVLLAAAINAFNEEVTYKASLVSALEGPVGPGQALWMVSAYFGIGHYYGVPYGLIGVAMAFALVWLLGRRCSRPGACSGPGSSTSGRTY